jgi:glycosyltransferase involved in cell wall biosynthesis
MAKVNIIMAVYNQADFLLDSINSVLNQSFADFDLIIINDGSKDKSEEVILSIKDERICYYSNGQNKGLIYSLNRGLEIAIKKGGKYIARMDSDDIAFPERLLQQVNYLDEHPSVGLLGTAVQYFGSTNKIRYSPVTQRKIIATLYCYNPFVHPTVVFRSDIIKDITFDPTCPKYEDYKLWIDLIGTCEFHNLPTVLLHYRKHPGSVTSSYEGERGIDHAMFKQILTHLNLKLGGRLTDQELETLSIITGPGRAKINPNIPLKELQATVDAIILKTDDSILDQAYLTQLLIERIMYYLLWNGRRADVLRLFNIRRIKYFFGIARSLASGKKWVVN